MLLKLGFQSFQRLNLIESTQLFEFPKLYLSASDEPITDILVDIFDT